MKTYAPKAGEVERGWYVVDASGVPLGRLSTTVASFLMGKHKPQYAPYLDTGDFVIVVNAEQVELTGRKEGQKVYYRHSGQPGKLRQESAEALRQRRPTQLVERAIKGMLPKNRMGRRLFRKLKVYTGAEHPHQAQQPQALEVAR
jgi:large subunit ribosomal protein L13